MACACVFAVLATLFGLLFVFSLLVFLLSIFSLVRWSQVPDIHFTGQYFVWITFTRFLTNPSWSIEVFFFSFLRNSVELWFVAHGRSSCESNGQVRGDRVVALIHLSTSWFGCDLRQLHLSDTCNLHFNNRADLNFLSYFRLARVLTFVWFGLVLFGLFSSRETRPYLCNSSWLLVVVLIRTYS